MSASIQFVQLLEDLQQNYSIEFPSDPVQEDRGRLRALLEVREQCISVMQDHFDEIIALIDHKKPCIESLAKMTAEYDQQIAELEARLPDRRRRNMQKEESVQPVKAARPLPKGQTA